MRLEQYQSCTPVCKMRLEQYHHVNLFADWDLNSISHVHLSAEWDLNSISHVHLPAEWDLNSISHVHLSADETWTVSSCKPVCRLRLESRFPQCKEETPLLNRIIQLLHRNVTCFIFSFVNNSEIPLDVICIRSTAATICKFASCLPPPVLQAEMFTHNLSKTWCQWRFVVLE